MTREPICQALFTKLQAAAGFVTVSRKFKHFADVAPADQPALILVYRGDNVTTVPGQPSVTTLSFDALIYAHTRGDPAVAPSSVMNPLVDAVVSALAPEPVSGKQTLGGLVQHAWVEGRIETDEGLLQDQGYAIVPISIKAV
jgi:hypothetical protein